MISIALDFDGVICNSQKECFETAGKLFKQNNNKFNFKLFYKQNYEILNFYRRFVINGEDYYFIIDAIFKKTEIFNQSDFLKYKMNTLNDVKKIRNDFYKIREHSINEDCDRWLKSNPLYSEISYKINSLLSKYKIFIVTTKDFNSVYKILSYNKIKIEPDYIYSNELNKTKNECLQEIINYHKCESLAFIDDQIENLLTINISRVDCYLASWGYNDSVQLEKAKKSNIAIIDINDFPKKLSRALHDFDSK